MATDSIDFAPEQQITTRLEKFAWRILIVDDDHEIHEITKLALSDYSLYGCGIEFLHAFDYAAAEKILRTHKNIALVLLDVVMDAHDSGLKLAEFIRKNLNNHLTRIVLRTGEPGEAPEKEVISKYDINDYKEKTELTATKLYTIVHTSLKNYCDLRSLAVSRQNLNEIIENIGELYDERSEYSFVQTVLDQLTNLLMNNPDVILLRANETSDTVALKFDELENNFVAMAGSGRFSGVVRNSNASIFDELDKTTLSTAISHGLPIQENGKFVCSIVAESGTTYILYIDNIEFLDRYDQSTLKVFLTHVSKAIDSQKLRNEIISSQFEVIETLGNVVEFRSGEVTDHVQRVAAITEILATSMQIPLEQVKILKVASTLHDLGKIGISDAILNKPGKLSEDEFRIVKDHVNIGHKILDSSTKHIFKIAAIIAKQHHEKWDGTGYPKGLKAEEIHQYARIVALADVYDALRTERVYKDAWGRKVTLEYILDEKGKHFSPEVVEHFERNESLINLMYMKDRPRDAVFIRS